MPNPSTEPIIGSSFDAIAAQRAGWAGFNNGVDRANLEAQARAQDARNQYLYNAAQLARQDQSRQDSLQASADSNARRQYEFGANLDLSNRQLLASEQEKKDATDAKRLDLQTGQKAYNQDQRLKQAQSEIQSRTFDPVNYADLPPPTLASLKRIDDAQRTVEQKNYFDSLALSQKMQLLKASNKKEGSLGDLVAWLKGNAADNSSLAPVTASETQGTMDQKYGITLDAATGRYKPVSVPPWMGFSGAATIAPQPQSMPPTQTGGPRVLDNPVIARQFLAQAGGDKNLARQLAIKAGYTIQPLQ